MAEVAKKESTADAAEEGVSEVSADSVADVQEGSVDQAGRMTANIFRNVLIVASLGMLCLLAVIQAATR